ncbi:MAG: type II toxin-antitoxin system RelE/ParE family toxin [Bacteroidia bacterium]|nr:type II toxin-antitoxin system RelE/ParE family toxin [Bacteroidia bacterium]
MVYKITINRRAIKTLEKINEPAYSAIKRAIYELANNPRPQGYKKLKGRMAFRIRVGDYRIIYEIFDEILSIEIVNLGHRKNIYEH